MAVREQNFESLAFINVSSPEVCALTNVLVLDLNGVSKLGISKEEEEDDNAYKNLT